MKDKELLLKAIDSYALLSPTYRKILKILVQIAIDDTAIITLKDLTEIASIARITTYAALSVLEQEGFIKKLSVKGSKMGSFILKPKKLQEIIDHYIAKENILL